MLAALQIISLIVGIVSGIVFLVIGIFEFIIKRWRVKKEEEATEGPVTPQGERLSRAVIMIIIFGFILAASWSTWAVTKYFFPPDVKITQPMEGSDVAYTETVKGISKRVPEGYTVWVMVSPDVDPNFYPNKTPATVQQNGDWFSGPIYIGEPDDTGNGFHILAVLANTEARDFLSTFIQQAKRTGKWGLAHMPKGAQIMDSVGVTRK